MIYVVDNRIYCAVGYCVDCGYAPIPTQSDTKGRFDHACHPDLCNLSHYLW